MQLISIKQTCALLGICRVALWHLTKTGDFPKPIQVTPGRKAFIAEEIDDWIRRKAEERRAA